MFIIIYIVSVLSGVAVAVFKHHTAPITSVEWHPSDSSVFAASGYDNQVTLLDLAVERETTRNPRKVEKKLEVPPQLLFIHMVCDKNVTYTISVTSSH